MHGKFMEMMKKKKGGEMSGIEKDAKSSVIQEMKKMAEDAMGDKMKGLKKVTVASNSPEGIEKGLEKAKEIISQMPQEEESSEEEMMEDEEYDEMDMKSMIENCDMDQLNKLEEMIKAKKLEMMKQ